jgi:hypothetical protein
MHMGRTIRLLLGAFVALAVLGMGMGEARAQSFPPMEFPALTLSYRDSQGAGSATLTSLGEDAATGGTRIAVEITQDGAVYKGQGFVRQFSNVQFVTAFWVDSPGGDRFYLLSGEFVNGFAGWSGQGRLETLGVDGDDQWSMSMVR